MEFKSKVTAPKTLATDSDDTLVTKDYVDGEILGVELTPGPPGAIGPTGPTGATVFVGNLDGGTPSTIYGGIDAISGGGVSNGD